MNLIPLLKVPQGTFNRPAVLHHPVTKSLRRNKDNLSSHKVAGIRESIESAGASLIYLPPYSPDLNPIEKAWSKVKKLLRDAAARTQEALEAAIAKALAAVTPEDAKAFFRSCGYPSH